MKRVISVLLAAAMMMAGASAVAESVPAAPAPAAQITVLGSGEVSALPDRVTVTVNASVAAPTMLEAQAQVSEIAQRTTQSLSALGILDEDVVTTDYGYNPMYSYEDDVRRLTGYQASHTMNVTCRNVQMLDSVIGAVTDSGMTDIYNISYDVADRGALYMQALELAIRAAEEKAMAMAAASGRTLTGLSSLTENQSYDARYAYKNVMMSEDSAAGTGIRSGSVSVSASVTAVYRAQ